MKACLQYNHVCFHIINSIIHFCLRLHSFPVLLLGSDEKQKNYLVVFVTEATLDNVMGGKCLLPLWVSEIKISFQSEMLGELIELQLNFFQFKVQN